MNALKTALLLGLMSGLLLVGGEAIGGRQGLYYALGIAAVTSFGSYFFSEKLALMTYSAQPVTPEENPNAFATGRNPSHASVAFTEGILQLMNDNEIEGVVAHELGHVLHRDILISSIAAMLAAAITFLARMAFWFGGSRDEEDRGGGLSAILMMILAPIAAGLIQMAISRSREYDADAASAKYVGSPYPLINGLQKLDNWSKRIPMDATPSTAHMFIIQPFTGESLMRLFSTHPSTEDRIARLQAMR